MGKRAERSFVAVKALFWCAFTAEVAWLVLATTAYERLFSVLGQKDFGFVHLLILGALALSSGLLVLLEKHANTFNDPEREWTLSETLYLMGPDLAIAAAAHTRRAGGRKPPSSPSAGVRYPRALASSLSSRPQDLRAFLPGADGAARARV